MITNLLLIQVINAVFHRNCKVAVCPESVSAPGPTR